MGFGLPAAIAAKLVHPERRVVAVSGDGGFLMNVQELETACRLGLAIVNVIFRDGGYNLIQWKQQQQLRPRGRRELRQPGLRRAGRGLRRTGYRVDSARELRPILAEALRTGPIDRRRAGRLWRERAAHGRARPAHLSDLIAGDGPRQPAAPHHPETRRLRNWTRSSTPRPRKLGGRRPS